MSFSRYLQTAAFLCRSRKKITREDIYLGLDLDTGSRYGKAATATATDMAAEMIRDKNSTHMIPDRNTFSWIPGIITI